MFILNDEHRQRAGIGSLSKRCQDCSEALAAYPLILSDDAGAVYHAARATELATEILIMWPGISQGQSNVWKRLFRREAYISGHFTWQKMTPHQKPLPAIHVRA